MHRIDTDNAQYWITVAGACRAYNQPLRGRRTLLGTVRSAFSSRLARMGTATQMIHPRRIESDDFHNTDLWLLPELQIVEPRARPALARSLFAAQVPRQARRDAIMR